MQFHFQIFKIGSAGRNIVEKFGNLKYWTDLSISDCVMKHLYEKSALKSTCPVSEIDHNVYVNEQCFIQTA